MAKFKPARGKKPAPSMRAAIPCLVVLILGFALLFLLFYYSMKAG